MDLMYLRKIMNQLSWIFSQNVLFILKNFLAVFVLQL